MYSFSYGDDQPSLTTSETSDPRIDALRPTLLKLNTLVLAEIEQGLNALKQKDLSLAIKSFITATNIAPYDPMAYILLIKTLISSNQENLAYKWLMISGRNLSDSNQIISNLYQSLKEFNPPLPTNISESIVSIAQFKDSKSCAISFTFDDGEPSVGTDILPLFEKFGYKATIAINPGMTSEDAGNVYRGNWNDWRNARKHGHEIANHGTHHKALPGLSPTELQTEVIESYKTITQKTGEAPLTFIFPEDKSSPELVKYVESIHLVARDYDSLTDIYKNICIPIYGGNRFSIPTARILIDIAIDRRLWLIPQCHGLYSSNIKKSFKAISKELLINQLEYLKQKSEEIWVGRFIDVYKYLNERNQTHIDVIKKTKKLVEFSLTNPLDPKVFDQPLTVIINPQLSSPIIKTKTYNLTSRKIISHQIKNNTILINTLANGDVIQVTWN